MILPERIRAEKLDHFAQIRRNSRTHRVKKAYSQINHLFEREAHAGIRASRGQNSGMQPTQYGYEIAMQRKQREDAQRSTYKIDDRPLALKGRL
jgi:hypothetical protein